MTYLDSSALVKLVTAESESAALERHLGTDPRLVSSTLAYVEVTRAARKRTGETVVRARRLLERVELLAVDWSVLTAAAELGDDRLRSLDAIHLAAAQALENDLAELITYDHRMTDAARALGLPVVAPA